MYSIPKFLQNIFNRAAKSAMPELTESLLINPEKSGAWDYQSPSAMQFFNKYKKNGSFGFKTCKDMATAIVENIPKDALEGTIEKVEISKIGNAPDDKAGYFLNIFLKETFIHARIQHLNAQ
jgi:arginyl-tRNA synthetase